MKEVYIELYHGRKDPNQDMDDWGTEGPILGPLNCVVTTYLHTIRLLRFCDENGEDLPPKEHVELFLAVYDDMIYYDGVFYGDWAVFADLSRANKGEGPVLPEESKAVVPEEYRECMKKSKNMLLYQFLESFTDSCSAAHREQAEEVWKALKSRGVNRECVRESLKQSGLLNAED